MNSHIIKLQLVYDELYTEAGEALKKHDPCQIRQDDGVVTCRDIRKRGPDGVPNTLCCGSCKHLGPNGCTVEALSCKVWLCSTARSASPTCTKKLEAIRSRAMGSGMYLGFRQSKEDLFSRILEE